ncbi:MAG: hypothetical protein ACEPOZ_02480 [Marinifilaceae bacterium]
MGIQDLKLSIEDLPLKSNFSFLPLIENLKQEVERDGASAVAVKDVLERLKEVPELMESSIDLECIHRNQEMVDRLLRFVIPFTATQERISVLTLPFDLEQFYCTQKYREVFEDSSKELNVQRGFLDPKWELYTKIMHAYIIILRQFYNCDLWVDNLFMYQLKDKYNGLENFFKVDVLAHSIDIKVLGELKALTKDEIYSLINKPFDVDAWLEMLPLDNFEFNGFLQLDFIDVTQLEVVSVLKTELLEKSSIVNPQKLKNLEKHVRSLLGLPNVKLGLIALHMNDGILENRSEFWKGFLNPSQFTCSDYQNSFYAQSLQKGETLLLNDLSQKKNPSVVEQGLLDQGIRNISVTPLFYEEELVGLLELGSTQAYDINFTLLKKIHEIIPVFSMAVKRSSEELFNRIQATIKEECTAIHPSVEWRFEDAAGRLLLHRDLGESTKMEEIVFHEVHPLYGAVDIRHSSMERNKTIKEDLVEQLNLASHVLKAAFELNAMPIYEQLIYKIEKLIDRLEKGLSTGDENSILNFLQSDVECLFEHIEKSDSRLKKNVQNYKQNLDSELKIVYKRRKAFEDSLMMINDCIIGYLDREEEKSQMMYPHYFEKYRTDGVEHNIYIGQSLVQGKQFNRIYLKNLRLWQLIVSCEISRLTHKLKPELPIPLDTTALILVHSQALSIRFRQDEKKFDVDGAYNIRYEIVKKRIDKALIKNTKERLTQPGKLAVIFSQEQEMVEYRRYLEYLIDKGYFEDKIEVLELEDLQGVYGLRALRVTILHQSNEKEILTVANELKLND